MLNGRKVEDIQHHLRTIWKGPLQAEVLYDVSSIISQEIFDYPALTPYHEWIYPKGDAMFKSKGVLHTWTVAEIAAPETLNYFIFRSKPMKHKDFNPNMPF